MLNIKGYLNKNIRVGVELSIVYSANVISRRQKSPQHGNSKELASNR